MNKTASLLCLLTAAPLITQGQTNAWTRDYASLPPETKSTTVIHDVKAFWDSNASGVALTWPTAPAEAQQLVLLRWHESPGPKGMIFDGAAPLHRNSTMFIDKTARRNGQYVYGLKTIVNCGPTLCSSYHDDVPYGFTPERIKYHNMATNIIVGHSSDRHPPHGHGQVIPIPPRAERQRLQQQQIRPPAPTNLRRVQ